VIAAVRPAPRRRKHRTLVAALVGTACRHYFP
jgi:hypothetical protein